MKNDRNENDHLRILSAYVLQLERFSAKQELYKHQKNVSII